MAPAPRPRGRVRLALVVLLILSALALASAAQASIWTRATERALANVAPLPRPTHGGDFAYEVPEAEPFVGARAVIHYVTSGLDAPPLNDDNGNGTPDYVEQAGAAAERALEFYAANGYKLPLSDSGGPNEKPDIYIGRLNPGFLGLAIPHAFAEGGSFIIISPGLDRSTDVAFGSLDATVAHELFHTVQFAYVPNGDIPRWAAEGSASAVELLVFPEIADVATLNNLDRWLREPWRPLYDERFGCDRCYGGAWWWYLLATQDPDLLPAYLGRLYGYQQQGVPIQQGLQPLNEVLKKSGYGSLYDTFTTFSLALYAARLNPSPHYSFKATKKVKMTRKRRVQGLSMHYVPVKVGPRARGVVLSVGIGRGPKPDVTLVVGGPNGRYLKPVTIRKGRVALFSVRFRNARERKKVVLIITSGRRAGVDYVVARSAL